MSTEPAQLESEANTFRQRKFRDAAALLPIFGVSVLATLIISAFTSVGAGSPLPRAVVYVFGVWAVLIFLAFILARRLRPDDGSRP
jgi:hypothetical protein